MQYLFAKTSPIRLQFALAVSLVVLWSTQSFAAGVAVSKEECIAAADRGQSLRDDGQYLAARLEFARCESDGCPAPVRAKCSEWLRKALDATPTVVFAASDGLGNDLSAVRVVVDGWPAANRIDGRSYELEIGAHEVRFEAAGRETVVVHVLLRVGDKNRVVDAVLPPRPLKLQNRGSFSVLPERLIRLPPQSAVDAPFLTNRTTVAIVLVAAGAAAGVAGLTFALFSRSDDALRATLQEKVGPGGCVHSSSHDCAALSDAAESQRRDFVLSNVFYAGAGTLVAAAITTWLLWPQNGLRRGTGWAVQPEVGLGGAGLRARMEFQ